MEDGEEGDAPSGKEEKQEVKGGAGSGPPAERCIVKKWSAVAYWAYSVDNDTCAICTNELMVPCLTTCEANPHLNEECTVSWGQCGHSYHFHCISNWLKKHSTCPLDDENWDFVTISASIS
eukprot:gb/GEZN01012061.1/.p2 GENE.gb/GEZN01012061.1/~~gb/GEZN01012061.1/.p2  ORF type:complete len:121 (-),score=16.06 gb/GEZN01012061.1/:109-471(-)